MSAEKLNGQECIITDIQEKDEYIHVLPLNNKNYLCTGIWIDEIEGSTSDVPKRCTTELTCFEKLLKRIYNVYRLF